MSEPGEETAQNTQNTLTTRLLRSLRRNSRVRQRLPGGALLRLDRRLPYLLVLRETQNHESASPLRGFVGGEASYLLLPATLKHDDADQITQIVAHLTKNLSDEFGAFLLLEIWAAPDGQRFTIHTPTEETRWPMLSRH